MEIQYENITLPIEEETLKINLERLCNQIFKLLPLREEEKDWSKPLDTLILELLGLYNLLRPEQKNVFTLVCKLTGLKNEDKDVDFALYRRTIFECCSLVDKIKNNVI